VPIEEHYDFEQQLGQCSHGVVHSAVDKRTGEKVAIKSIKKRSASVLDSFSDGSPPTMTGYHQEFELLRAINEQQQAQPSEHNLATWSVHNSHVIRLLHAYDEYPEELDRGEFHLVQELLTGGELYAFLADTYIAKEDSLLPDEPVLSEALAISFVQQMLMAVEACHFTGLAHLDIKPENFIFEGSLENGNADPSSRLVLVDFGCAEAFAIAPYAARSRDYKTGMDDVVDLRRAAGTLMYVSPEVINGNFSSRSDTWSIGAVLFLMLHGATPYASNTLTSLSAKPANVPGGGVQADWSVAVSPELQEFVMKLLSPKAADRLSATEALDYIEQYLQPALAFSSPS